MKKKHLLFTTLALALGSLTGGSEAMAQNGWESGFTQSQTTSTTWEALSTGSTTGKTLGESGTTKYYYLQESLTFTNTNAGGSGLTIKGTVYLYIPYGLTITCVGADASGATGAGAGIELAEGNTLYIIGSGDGVNTTVTAKGGKAALLYRYHSGLCYVYRLPYAGLSARAALGARRVFAAYHRQLHNPWQGRGVCKPQQPRTLGA